MEGIQRKVQEILEEFTHRQRDFVETLHQETVIPSYQSELLEMTQLPKVLCTLIDKYCRPETLLAFEGEVTLSVDRPVSCASYDTRLFGVRHGFVGKQTTLGGKEETGWYKSSNEFHGNEGKFYL